jgi:uncharacterized membrane protein YgaE (UPF0421/DUF939 family)
MFKIGYRTFKTAVGAASAIGLAEWMQLEQYATAGIITILCIQPTRKRSLRSSWARFAACMLGMGASFLFFEGLGYTPISIAIMLLLFIPLLVMLNIQTGVVTSMVIIMHLYMFNEINWHILLNEVGLITIGIGVAFVVNFYMPNFEKELRQLQQEIERNYSKIFHEFAHYLREGDNLWDGREITETTDLIDRAKSLAYRDVENHFLRHEDEFYYYFQMREKQFEIIERLLPIISALPTTVAQGRKIAEFLDDLSRAVHSGNTAHIYLEQLQAMRDEFRAMKLPETREEFETRAMLLHFIKEMERYLIVKSRFKHQDS